MSVIPASQIVSVVPSVLAAAGAALDIIGLALTNNARVPVGEVLGFPGSAAVGAFFGLASHEFNWCEVYFNGFTGADQLPGAVLFAQYPSVPIAAWLHGGSVASLTLAQLQAISGTLTAVVDGYSRAGGTVSLAADTSFSQAATTIATALNTTLTTEATFTASLGAAFTATGTGTSLAVTSVTGLISIGDAITGTGVPTSPVTTFASQVSGTVGGAGTYLTNQATTASTASCTCASDVLDVTICASPTITPNLTLAGSGVTGTPIIGAQLSGTSGGVGTYLISGAQQHVVSEAMTGALTPVAVTYDATSGGFWITSGATGVGSTAAYATGTAAAPLGLTLATGAVLSQGAAAATPAAFMTGVTAVTQDWVTFGTLFDPDGGTGNAQKIAFAVWNGQQNNQFCYVDWDNDITVTESVPASSSQGQILAALTVSGTCLIYEPTDLYHGAFVMGLAAAIDFTEEQGSTNFAFRNQSGLTPGVTNGTVAQNVLGNNYNYYGIYKTRANRYSIFYDGKVSGPFKTMQNYINQIWLNAAFQDAIFLGLTQAKSVPYDAQGTATIQSWCLDPINAAVFFGAIQPGVALSAAEAQAVNTQAGVKIDGILSTRGWYLQVLPAAPAVRAVSGSPPCTFWYTGGGSVNKINLASIAVQ